MRAGSFVGLSLLFVTCSHSPDPQVPPSTSSTPLEACAELRGAHFRSVEHFPGGLGPDGPTVGYQYLSISEDLHSYEWTKEDMVFTGPCYCRDGSIEAAGAPFTNDLPFTASFDSRRGVLNWSGVEFVRLP